MPEDTLLIARDRRRLIRYLDTAAGKVYVVCLLTAQLIRAQSSNHFAGVTNGQHHENDYKPFLHNAPTLKANLRYSKLALYCLFRVA